MISFCVPMNTEQLDIIDDEDLNFIVEEMPNNIGLIDKYRFKYTILRSINDYIVRSFFVGNFLVIVHTNITIRAKKVFSCFFVKINLLKKMLSYAHTSEIWVIKDKKYLCIGMYYGEPIFLRSFSDVYNADNNLPLIVKSMKGYSADDNTVCRFFCCLSDDFQNKTRNYYEYLDEQIMYHTNGQTIYEFCLNEMCSHSSAFIKAKPWIVGTVALLSLLSSICAQQILNSYINQYDESSIILQDKTSITYKTYKQVELYDSECVTTDSASY